MDRPQSQIFGEPQVPLSLHQYYIYIAPLQSNTTQRHSWHSMDTDCVGVSRLIATGNCEWRTCPKFLTCRLKRDSNTRHFGQKATNLPMSLHALQYKAAEHLLNSAQTLTHSHKTRLHTYTCTKIKTYIHIILTKQFVFGWLVYICWGLGLYSINLSSTYSSLFPLSSRHYHNSCCGWNRPGCLDTW